MSQSIDREHHDSASSPLAEDATPTKDLKDRYRPRITATEQRLRTRGTWMIVSGIITVLLALGCAIVWFEGFSRHMPALFLLPVYGAGFGAIMLGCLEYLNRPTRETQQHGIARIDHLENRIDALAEILPEIKSQIWYTGYVTHLRDTQLTGTDNGRAVGTADVVKLQRRNDRDRPRP